MDEPMNWDVAASQSARRLSRSARDTAPPSPSGWDAEPPQPVQPAWDAVPAPQAHWNPAPAPPGSWNAAPAPPGNWNAAPAPPGNWDPAPAPPGNWNPAPAPPGNWNPALPPQQAWGAQYPAAPGPTRAAVLVPGAPDVTMAPPAVEAATRRTASGRAARRPRAVLVLNVDLARIRRWLYAAMYVIVALDLAASIGAAEGAPYFLTRFFDGDDKINFPTGYKTTFLLSATVLCMLLATLARRRQDPFAAGWTLLTLVCGFAFTDETIYLHQALSDQVQKHFHTGGYLAYAWTIVYVPGVVVVGVILVRYLRYLDAVGRLPLLAGGAVYAFGAVAWEPIKSKIATVSGDGGLAFKLVACASDSMEMIGMTILVVALLGYLIRQASDVTFALKEQL